MKFNFNIMTPIQQLEESLAADRIALLQHPLYQQLKSMDDIRLFMQYHVFAVWDFMSLLKALQQRLTCTQVPWMPPADPNLARFINEIVLGEETDVDEDGQAQSHYELYRSAMEQAGANGQLMDAFLKAVQHGASISDALDAIDLPKEVHDFVQFTFDLIESGKAHWMAAAFTFGREDLIPDMFLQIIEGAEATEGKARYSKLTYYLQRHIEVDGDEHGPLALQMIEVLCGNSEQKWAEALDISKKALAHRHALWDGVLRMVETERNLLHA